MHSPELVRAVTCRTPSRREVDPMKCAPLVLFCAVALFGSSPAKADVVDQSNAPPITGSTSQTGGVSTTPILQEFTPTLTSVDFVRVGVKNFDTVAQPLTLDIFAVNSSTHTTTGGSLGT